MEEEEQKKNIESDEVDEDIEDSEEELKEESKKKLSAKEFLEIIKRELPIIKKKLSGKNGVIAGAILVGALFFLVITVRSCSPKEGSIIYGMCGAFLEQQITFPETIKYSEVEQYQKAVRIYYTHVNGFGEYQLEMIECSFTQDPEKGVQMEGATFGGVKEITKKKPVRGKGRLFKVEQIYIDKFNKSLSPAAILSQDPDLALPPKITSFY